MGQADPTEPVAALDRPDLKRRCYRPPSAVKTFTIASNKVSAGMSRMSACTHSTSSPSLAAASRANWSERGLRSSPVTR